MKELKVKEILTNELEIAIDEMIKTTGIEKQKVLDVTLEELVDYVIVCKQYEVLEIIVKMLLN